MDKPIDIPKAFLDRMAAELGPGFPAFSNSLESPGPVSVRWNPEKNPALANGYPGRPVAWCATGKYLDDRPAFPLEPLWHAGAFYVQEASSMFLEQVVQQLDLPEEALVLDACAAPGGKSTHLLGLLGPRALLVANEPVPKRNRILQENLQKWGYPNTLVTRADAPELGRLYQRFDLVLADAPCSGEGMFRRDMGARRDWSPQHVAACAQRQCLLLDSLAPAVRPGGYLIYSTCTWAEEEDEAQVRRLLDNGDWEAVAQGPDGMAGAVAGKNGIGYRFYPHRIPGEGFYIACLRKHGAGTERRTGNRSGKALSAPAGLEQLADLSDMACLDHRGETVLFPAAWQGEAEILSKALRTERLGTPAGSEVRGAFNPAHDLALSILLKNDVPSMELSLDQARTYLRKGPVAAPQQGTTGWHVVRYLGVALGWAKVLPGRVNNYYPKYLSIRP